MKCKNQRRFSEQEIEWMRSVAPKMRQVWVAKELGVRVTAVNNWARRTRTNFLGARIKFNPITLDSRYVADDRAPELMALEEKTRRRL